MLFRSVSQSRYALRLILGTRFQVLFHSPSGVLFTFPSRYSSLSVTDFVFSLTRWSSQIRPGFHVPRVTRDTRYKKIRFRLQDYHPLWSDFPDRFTYQIPLISQVPRPPDCSGFRLFPVRSPLLRKSLLFSLPAGT